MANHPNRKQPPSGLEAAIRRDMARHGEGAPEWGARRGVPQTTVEQWLLRPPSGHLARLLAEELGKDHVE